MAIPDALLKGLRLPLIAAPMFLVSGPDLVVEVCRSGAIGAFPALNARRSEDFAAWLDEVAPDGCVPVFVGFNAPFDWMFIADYLHRFVGRNPFGYAAMDLKAVYLGRHGVTRWSETTKEHVRARHPVTLPHTHNALDDARFQAMLARQLLDFDAEAPRDAPDPDAGPAQPA